MNISTSSLVAPVGATPLDAQATHATHHHLGHSHSYASTGPGTAPRLNWGLCSASQRRATRSTRVSGWVCTCMSPSGSRCVRCHCT